MTRSLAESGVFHRLGTEHQTGGQRAPQPLVGERHGAIEKLDGVGAAHLRLEENRAEALRGVRALRPIIWTHPRDARPRERFLARRAEVAHVGTSLGEGAPAVPQDPMDCPFY